MRSTTTTMTALGRRRTAAAGSVVAAAVLAALLATTGTGPLDVDGPTGPVAAGGVTIAAGPGADAVLDPADPLAAPAGQTHGETAGATPGEAPAPLPVSPPPAEVPGAEPPHAADPVAEAHGAGDDHDHDHDHDNDHDNDPPAEAATAPGSAAITTEPDPAAADATAPAVPAPGVVTGTLVRAWAERLLDPDAGHEHAHTEQGAHDDATATLKAWVRTGDAEAYPVDPADVQQVEDGSTVTVELGPRTAATHTVVRLLGTTPPVAAAGELLYGEGSPDVFGVAAAGVVHDVTVVLATPPGAARDTMTAASVAATVNGGVHTYWSQQTRGQRGFRVVAQYGWQSLATSCSDPWGLWREVAGKVGWVEGPRKHLLVYIPSAAGCGAGLGSVGGPDTGGQSWVGHNSTSIIAHELGHNLGLGHSNGLLCSGAADGRYASGAWSPGCASYDYRDYYDVMGISWDKLGSLAAPQADALGVLRSTEKLVTSAPVRVRLAPATSDGLRVLRIDDPGGAYYVEYRVATGWDSWLASNYRGLDAGVLVHRTSPVRAREVLLLDGSVTDGTRTSDWRSALGPGGSLTTASGVTRVVVEQADDSGATVVVYRDGVGPTVVKPPADGSHVAITAPTATTAGTTVFSGIATAPEGTLLWEVLQGGVRKASGYAAAGANGSFGSFQVPVALPAGSFTFRAWVPDESGGEMATARTGLADEVSVTLR